MQEAAPALAAESDAGPPGEEATLTLRGFDLARVLEQGTQLLASGGQVPALCAPHDLAEYPQLGWSCTRPEAR